MRKKKKLFSSRDDCIHKTVDIIIMIIVAINKRCEDGRERKG